MIRIILLIVAVVLFIVVAAGATFGSFGVLRAEAIAFACGFAAFLPFPER